MRFSPTSFARLAGIALVALLPGCWTEEPEDFAGTWTQTDLAGGDVDNDGRADVVTVAMLKRASGATDGYVKVHRQQNGVTFAAEQYAVGRYPWRVEIADMDGDGRQDLLVLDVDGTATRDDVLYLLRQDPNNRGRFLAPRAIATGLATYDFTVTDINRDGAPDVLIAGGANDSNGVQFLLQSLGQRGTFLPPATFSMPGRATDVTTGDLDGDGVPDLVAYSVLDFSTGADAPGHVTIAYGQPLGGYGTPAALDSQVGLSAHIVRVTDVDGDGRADIVVPFAGIAATFEPRIRVLRQTVAGRFTAVDTSIAGLRGLDGFVVADLDGDARPDVGTTGSFPAGSPGTVRSRTNILAPATDGTYALDSAIDMPVAMDRIDAVDVDGDGLNDILLLGDANRAYVMLQSRTSPGTFVAPRAL